MEQLISDIQAYCRAIGIETTTLGLYAVGDGKFFARISSGGQCLPRTEKRVRDYMAANPAPERGEAA